MWEDIFRHLNHLPVHLLRDSRVARIEHDIDQVCLTPNPEHVDSPCKRARTVSSCTCYGKRRQCLPLILCKRVASNWLMLTVDRKDESLIQLSEANLTPVLHSSFSFNTETSLEGINLEDSKDRSRWICLEKTGWADLAALPFKMWEYRSSFEYQSLLLTSFTHCQDLRFGKSKEDNLLFLEVHLDPTNASVIPPLVETLHVELLDLR